MQPQPVAGIQPEPATGPCYAQSEMPAVPCTTGNGCPTNCCCTEPTLPNLFFFGEYLYLRPLNAGVEYAVPINGPIAQGEVPIQMGPTASVGSRFPPGFRSVVASGLIAALIFRSPIRTTRATSMMRSPSIRRL